MTDICLSNSVAYAHVVKIYRPGVKNAFSQSCCRIGIAQCKRVRMLPTVLSSVIYCVMAYTFLRMKATLLCVLLCLLWSLVEVQSQTEHSLGETIYPTIPMWISLEWGKNDLTVLITVQCHTDLMICCSDTQELPPGDWFAPGSDTPILQDAICFKVVNLK